MRATSLVLSVLVSGAVLTSVAPARGQQPRAGSRQSLEPDVRTMDMLARKIE
jgi:hypothetical protein